MIETPLCVVPTSQEQLNTLVEDAVQLIWNMPPIPEDETTYSMRFGRVRLLIHANQGQGLVELTTTLIDGITEEALALRVVNKMNCDSTRCTFLLIGTAIAVCTNVQAVPFVPDHLPIAISGITDFVNSLDDDLPATLGGKWALSA